MSVPWGSQDGRDSVCRICSWMSLPFSSPWRQNTGPEEIGSKMDTLAIMHRKEIKAARLKDKSAIKSEVMWRWLRVLFDRRYCLWAVQEFNGEKLFDMHCTVNISPHRRVSRSFFSYRDLSHLRSLLPTSLHFNSHVIHDKPLKLDILFGIYGDEPVRAALEQTEWANHKAASDGTAHI